MKLLAVSLITALLLATSQLPSHAGTAENYVNGLVGNWRGSGTVQDAKGKAIRLNCKTSNNIRKAKRYLSMRGRCAASSGSRSMVGRLRYSDDGSRLSSGSLTIAGSGGPMSVSLNGNTLTLSGSQKVDDKVYKTRAVVTGGGSAYSITFFARIDGVWKNRGNLKFRR